MKILSALSAVAGKMIHKSPGLYVMRPVVNGARWTAWAEKFGVPNPVPADRLHVTVVYSRTGVKTKPQTFLHEVLTERAVIQMMGADSSVLTVLWDDCVLADRNWFFRQYGATSDWNGYRAHMTLSYDAAGFEVPAEALAEMPEILVLGPEVHSPLNENAVADLKKSLPASPADVPDEGDIAFAKSALDYAVTNGLGSPLERAILRDISYGHAVAAGDVVVIGKAEWIGDVPAAIEAPAEVEKTEPDDEALKKAAHDLMKAAVLDPQVAPETVEVLASIARGDDVPVMTIAALPQPVLDKLSGFTRPERELLKSDALQVDNEEQRIAWGWASVSLKSGEEVVDAHNERITTKALYDMAHGLISGTRAGNFDHVGETRGEIIEAMVFCAERQKALGIDLGQEGLLIAMRFPDDKDWELVKSGDWMFSIEARAIIEERHG